MTQADSVHALRMSLDSGPTHGQGQAQEPSLPHGWASFCSKPDSSGVRHWYATAPWDAARLRKEYGEAAQGIQQTLDAFTWPELRAKVRDQAERVAALTGDAP